MFRVDELDCATEEHDLQEALSRVNGVTGLSFDLVARRVTIDHELGASGELATAIRAAGMHPAEITADAKASMAQRALPRRTLIEMVVAGVLAIGSELVVVAGYEERSVLVAAMALSAIAVGGRDTLRKGLRALLARRLTMSLLMSVAVIGAVAVGQWPEAAVVAWLFGVAELIEALSLERARNAIRSLVSLAPETAAVRTGDGIDERPAADIAVGTIIVIRPGERVALDGEVIDGSSSVDQAPITGESIPVAKAAADAVYAGSINQNGTLDVRVTAAKGEGTLDRIARSIQEAQAERAPAQRFVDRFASVYTPIVFVAAIATATVPVIAGLGSFDEWLYRALVLLVLACPCALVISTPVTVVAGLGGAARRGILIKGGVHLEQARHLRVLALDKTGTLTHGRPAVTDVHVIAGGVSDHEVAAAGRLRRRRLRAPRGPRHHQRAGPDPCWRWWTSRPSPDEASPASLPDAATLLGNHRLAEETARCGPAVEAVLESFELDAKTAVVLIDDDRVLAVIAVADTIRPETPDAIRELHRLGVEPVMLTGDNQRTADAVSRHVGITEVHGDLLPEDKLRLVARLAARGPVGMIGDGINDAPALAKADLGFAMGAAGTDTAIETADIALMDDDPRKLAELIEISQHTTHVLWQNIIFAIIVKGIFFGLTFAGIASLWLAVLADMGASLIVIANGLRLLRRPSHRRHDSRHVVHASAPPAPKPTVAVG